jgi:hypothetical protein
VTEGQPSQDGRVSTVLGRRLGSELLHLRLAAGLTQGQAAKVLTASTGKVAKMEGGWVPIRDPDIRALCELYDVGDQSVAARLLDLARMDRERRKAKGWWNELPGVGDMREYVSMENAATAIRTWQLSYVPGLLQTPAYIRALVTGGSPQEHPDGGESKVAPRIARQQRLTGDSPLALWAIIHESTLRHLVGGPDVMREQLAHLSRVTRQSTIRLQVLPFSAGAHVGMSGSFNIISFDAPGSMDVVYTETVMRQLWVEGGDGATEHNTLFARLSKQALSEQESRALIDVRHKEL